MSEEWPVQAGAFEISELSETPTISGQTPGRVKSRGRANLYEANGPEGLSVILRYEFWETGECDIHLHDRRDAPPRFDRLRHGLRLVVEPCDGDRLVSLRQAQLKNENWSNLFDASEDDLDAGAGAAVRDALMKLGATAIGPRRLVTGQDGRSGGRLCARFPVDCDIVPVAAYVLTRIAPIANGRRA